MQTIGREGPRPFAPRTRTKDMETAEETRARKIEAREQRDADRVLAGQIAETAAHQRSKRNAGTLLERVDRARQRIEKAPAGAVVDILSSLSPNEREVYLLAEEYGPNRSQLLRMFPPPRKATREEYERLTSEDVELIGPLADEARASVALDGETQAIEPLPHDPTPTEEGGLAVFETPEALAQYLGAPEEK